jgi:predicted phosphodiesterase
MRIAVLSDVHGNLDALRAVFEDLDQAGIETVFCLGDLIGYGPEPDAVVLAVRDREIQTVMGNHELGIIDPVQIKWFNPPARESLKITAGMLSKTSLAFITNLEPSRVAVNCRFVHGFPLDSVKTYAFAVTDNRICNTFKTMPEKICFIGHTHLLEIMDYSDRELLRSPLPEGITQLSSDSQYIINIGSVGQPRDGNHDAKYIIFDTEKLTVELRYIAYDIQAVMKKIRAAGLPETHAERLR